MKIFLLFFLWALALVSCQQRSSTGKTFFDMDSLIDNQAKYLITKKASITKHARVDTATDKSTFTPDEEGWSNELDVFRHLELINKPIYALAYEVTNGTKDHNSNLTVMMLNAKYDVPVKQFKIYYQDDPRKLRKIEAKIEEKNSLYYTSRRFAIELDEHQGVLAFSRFNVSGVQKLILRDSVKFSISSVINY